MHHQTVSFFVVVIPLFNLFNFDIPADAANEVRGVVEGS
jgi:hypothetical protein